VAVIFQGVDSGEECIVIAVIADCFWAAFFVRLFQGRRAVLVRLR